MLQKVGYSLIDGSNTEIQFWGNTLWVSVDPPTRIVLDNGDIVEPIKMDERFANDLLLVERWIESNPTTEIDVKVGETIEFREDKTVVVYNYELPTVDDLKKLIKQKLANRRWEVETGGVSVDGFTYATDRESQTKYTAISIAISRADPTTWSINWKTSNGVFVTLNASQMENVINLVLRHVEQSFNHEALKVQEIDACTTVQELLDVDINDGWHTETSEI